jgi:tRNA threonylcarbamoyladenosine biosynthesis protein TsaE
VKITLRSEADLGQAARKLLNAFPSGRVFALYGSMGAGKTTFIKALCHELGVGDIVQSPSFAIVNEYLTGAGESIYHFDFYRVKSISEVFDIGYENYLFSGNYCFLEWPEKVERLLPEGTVRVRISGEDERLIEVIQD